MFKLFFFGCMGLLSSELIHISFQEVTASEVVKSLVQLAIGVITIYKIISNKKNKNGKV